RPAQAALAVADVDEPGGERAGRAGDAAVEHIAVDRVLQVRADLRLPVVHADTSFVLRSSERWWTTERMMSSSGPGRRPAALPVSSANTAPPSTALGHFLRKASSNAGCPSFGGGAKTAPGSGNRPE